MPTKEQVVKVWIDPGCIVCDACENEAPAVFQVLADTCIVRDNAPLTGTGEIVAAADGCPVDVIKYEKAEKSYKVGDKLELIVPHCDPVVNEYDQMYAIRKDKVEAVWAVAARGHSQ